ncbi:MAG: metallophosphoesterase [Verrucomicrobiota bacterium]
MTVGNTQRRGFLSATLGGVVAGGAAAMAAENTKNNTGDGGRFRFAHFTDMHIGPESNSATGLAAALRHMQSLNDKPEMLITGGDIVSEAMGATEKSANEQYALVEKVFEEECHIPVRHCLGNHDVWGQYKESKATGKERLWGKKLPMAVLGLDERYYSFDQGNWRFVVLDSIFLTPGYYKGQLDDEQFEWLEKELAKATDRHVVVVSHIPILSVAAYFLGSDAEKSGDWKVPGHWMHIDSRRITNLFAKHPNVKLCISGHMHMVDRVEYKGTTYICDGSISGNWWKGSNRGFSEGYGVFDLHADGTFAHEYTTFGWDAKK